MMPVGRRYRYSKGQLFVPLVGLVLLRLILIELQQADAAAGRLVDSVRALQQAGARYIMVWMLPDLGLTPLLNGTSLQPFISQLSSRFNDELLRQLRTVDAEVIPLNIPALLKEGFANPAQFGLATDQNLMTTCFSGKGCTENERYGIHSATPDPTELIYNDMVHPIEAGQRLISDYAHSLLAAPWEITRLPEMAHGSLLAHQNELRNQWQADWGNWQAIGQWRAIVSTSGQHQDYDSQRREQRRRQRLQPESGGQLSALGVLAGRGIGWRRPAETIGWRQRLELQAQYLPGHCLRPVPARSLVG